MKDSEELFYDIALTQMPGIGDVYAKKLVAFSESSKAIFTEKKSNLLKIPGVGTALVKAIADTNTSEIFKRAEEEVEFIKKHKIKALNFKDSEYPRRLQHCTDSPYLLFYKGNADLNNTKVLGIVGTRKVTEYGIKLTQSIVKHFEGKNVLIVSGLAYGVDIESHRAALQCNLNTIGVVAHGLDMIYPSTHKSIASRMVKQGGILTDFLSKTNPDRENFPKRNRIVAGMCDAIVVVEAAEGGGALITADIANSYSRDVFAIPGRAGDTYSEGCNNLIKYHKAALACSGADIEKALGWEEKPSKKNNIQKQLWVELNPDESIVLNTLTISGIATLDEIAINSGLPVGKTSSTLLTLELNGTVKSLPGKRYQVM